MAARPAGKEAYWRGGLLAGKRASRPTVGRPTDTKAFRQGGLLAEKSSGRKSCWQGGLLIEAHLQESLLAGRPTGREAYLQGSLLERRPTSRKVYWQEGLLAGRPTSIVEFAINKNVTQKLNIKHINSYSKHISKECSSIPPDVFLTLRYYVPTSY